MACTPYRADLTAEQVRAALHYDPETGVFIWLATRSNRAIIGTEAGNTHILKNGMVYRRIGFNGKNYVAHRLAWLWMTGEWPPFQIDHEDGDGLNNRITNLRPATNAQNSHNKRKYSNNTSGFKGVSWHKQVGRWQAKILNTYIGMYDTPEEAHAAYCLAAQERFGQYARGD